MKQITEYWISPLDDEGDVLDQFYYDSKKDAEKDLLQIKENIYPQINTWQIDRVVCKYNDIDGDLIDRDYTDTWEVTI